MQERQDGRACPGHSPKNRHRFHEEALKTQHQKVWIAATDKNEMAGLVPAISRHGPRQSSPAVGLAG